uniref:DUF2281 domain-containing protein n=1 Tax=Candidatus Kentrum sp. FW TaxID=2126338 RepID=A0A450T1J0_9GAMM|nr:MAG: hypothetical protein BECKFW1821A_GA0114235_10987 [Candidatus Kentron sp. FW]
MGLTEVMEEIRLVPEHRLPEIYDFIHSFKSSSEPIRDDTKEIMQFAGCWQDMTRGEFEALSQEIADRRRRAFSDRTTRETIVD